MLQVELLHLYPEQNAKLHHTQNYELIYSEPPFPVLRRGTPFTAALRFANRPFNEASDFVKLVFTYGPRPEPLKGTKVSLRLTSKKIKYNSKLWSIRILNFDDTTVNIQIQAAIDCPVGNWSLFVETGLVNSTEPPQVFEHETDVYFLFNPWHKDDCVYMPQERLLDEYIMTDVGKIWVGPMGSSRGREWVFGQFDNNVLLGTMLMLQRSSLAHASRGDPIKVTREISKLVNSNDDDGVLVGRWDGEYDDGTAPAAWTGSVAIMEEFLEKEQPVNYGQCWVFAGVVTSICRALGIPSRVVSNLVSAHDANSSLSVDRYYDENNEALTFDPKNSAGGSDSIWNYHVWNDVWMARNDLPAGYGGWQAVDATPQETSGGFYQCGPAPLEAIKTGQVGYNFDVGFMLASVNADIMNWKEDSTSDLGYSKIYSNKYHIGRMILTKKPWIYDPNGDQDREDITNQYKAEEGTGAERLSLLNAVRGTELAKSFYALPSPTNEDMEFELEDLERINIGEPFRVTIKITNKSKDVRRLKASLSAGSVYYNGVKAHLVKKSSGEFEVQPDATETLSMNVTADHYLEKLVEYGIMKIYAIATVIDTNQTWADEDDFQVLKPNISIKMPEDVFINKDIEIILRFKNPLKKMLSNCKFNIGGSGLIKNQILPYQNIEPNENVVFTTTVVPKKLGEQTVIATFSSRELTDITGSIKVEVIEAEE